MIKTCDVGSLPLRGEASRIEEGAERYNTLLELLAMTSEALDFFEEQIIQGLADKIRSGINVANYPQYRDMNKMFLDVINGVKHGESGYLLTETPSLKNSRGIPEVDAIRRNLSEILCLTGCERVGLKLCVTGPYTLSSLFKDRNPGLFRDLSACITEIVSYSIFKDRRGEVELLSVDEPVFGFIDDPLLDFGSGGRESLLKGWNEICYKASAHGVDSILHLHNTGNSLFWDVEHLDIIESHVNDPLYDKQETKQLLEDNDKFLKASISITQFDDLIEGWLRKKGYSGSIPERTGKIWTSITRGEIDPMRMLEERDVIYERLEGIVMDFGSERVPYAGPECGLSSFPSYESALETLRRTSEAVARLNKHHSAD
ncbi:MAG: hypothetical protein ACLFVP_09545 [Candidatus Bathyarchaeia archaeon]